MLEMVHLDPYWTLAACSLRSCQRRSSRAMTEMSFMAFSPHTFTVCLAVCSFKTGRKVIVSTSHWTMSMFAIFDPKEMYLIMDSITVWVWALEDSLASCWSFPLGDGRVRFQSWKGTDIDTDKGLDWQISTVSIYLQYLYIYSSSSDD